MADVIAPHQDSVPNSLSGKFKDLGDGSFAPYVALESGSIPSAAATIADGANVVEGATTDSAVTTDTTGTINGKLRGLVKWAFERMPASLGQKAMAGSLSVVLASDQSTITVAGSTATGSSSPGNPVMMGVLTDSTLSTLTNGQLNYLKGTIKGYLLTAIGDGSGTASAAKVTTPADGLSNSTNFVFAHNAPLLLNGAGTWDRVRGNEEATLLASGARTTTQTSADLVNYNGLGALIVVLDVTSAGTGSVTVSIDGKDAASGKYINLLTGAAVTTNSTNRYRIGPNLAASANAIAQDYVPRIFRIVVTANNANAMTYSVGYQLIRG